MSKKQRRGHKIQLLVSPLKETAVGYHPPKCAFCGDRISAVYNRALPVKSRYHWRHWRRT